VDPHHVDVDPDPVTDPANHFDADPDAGTGYHNDADPCGSGSTSLFLCIIFILQYPDPDPAKFL
jgi:hypothetical protein